MTSPTVYESPNADSVCADFVTMGERELAAFFNAITQLFGSEQAELSAEDWIKELTETEALPASAREWRLLTAKASTRIARRVNASAISSRVSTESQVSSNSACVHP